MAEGLHVGFVTYGLPSETSNGGPMTCWGIAKHLVDRGHRLTMCVLLESSDPFRTPDRIEKLRALGATLHIVEHDRFELWQRGVARGARSFRSRVSARAAALLGRPDLARYYPWAELRSEVAAIFERASPDVIFCYHFEALAAAHGLTVAPRMAGVGDLYHLPFYYRWKTASSCSLGSYISGLNQLRLRRIHQPLMRKLMGECDAKGAFAAHYAAWFRQHGLSDTRYLHTPIVDPFQGRSRSRSRVRSGKPRILMIGDLPTTVTRSGMTLFAREVLPALERLLGSDGFEVHIVGGGELSPEQASALRRPSIKLRGRVDPPDGEFEAADLLLVPTPIDLGIRVRAVTSWAHGCPVVVHSANRAGIPEIEHERNALVADSGVGLAEQVARALADENLRAKLSVGGRQTYEAHFAPDIAAAEVRTELERIARPRAVGRAVSGGARQVV
jgi:glycosyltransferase involved in cell wall biosynthesis